MTVDAELDVDDEKRKHDGTGEDLDVNDPSDANDLAKSTQTLSVELSVSVPLLPELQQPFHLVVKEQSQSDDAEEMDDHTDSCHTTKSSRDSCLTQSAESANHVDPEASVPFEEHPLSSSNNNGDSVDDRSESKSTTSTSLCTTSSPPSIEHRVPCTCSTGTDLHTNASLELNYCGDHKHDHSSSIIDIDLSHSDLTTEVHDQVVEDDDRSSTNSGIITTSACFRKEWSDTNSESQSSTTGLLSRSGSYGLSDSFNSCDRFSVFGDGTRSGVHYKRSPERVSDAPRESVSCGEMVERPTSLAYSSFRQKKTWDPGFYAASKIIMTRSKCADLRRIGDDFTISQALLSPFHDISGDSFGSRSPEEVEVGEEEVCPSKIAGHHQFGRSLSLSSVESVSSSLGSLQGDDSSGRYIYMHMYVREREREGERERERERGR